MDVKVSLKNSNEKKIRFKQGAFQFFAGSTYGNKDRKTDILQKEIAFNSKIKSKCDTLIAAKGDPADPEQLIGKASAPFFIPDGCNDVQDIVLNPGGVENLVVFHVHIGRSEKQAFAEITHLLNCIGNPSVKTPYINIKGEFDLGIRSPRGWTEVEKVRIEWKFVPEFQDRVNFMTADSNQESM